MTREEVIKLGLLTEEQLRSKPVMSIKQFELEMAKEMSSVEGIEQMFNELLVKYEDIFEE